MAETVGLRKACADTTGNATLNHKYRHQNQDQHHGGLTLHRLLRTGSHCGMVSGHV